DGYEAVTGLLGGFFGSREDLGEGLREIDLAVAARDFGELGECRIVGEPRRLGVAAGPFDERRRHALVVVEQDLQHMFGRELLMPLSQCIGLSGLQEAADSLRVFLDIHIYLHGSPSPYGARR